MVNVGAGKHGRDFVRPHAVAAPRDARSGFSCGATANRVYNHHHRALVLFKSSSTFSGVLSSSTPIPSASRIGRMLVPNRAYCFPQYSFDLESLRPRSNLQRNVHGPHKAGLEPLRAGGRNAKTTTRRQSVSVAGEAAIADPALRPKRLFAERGHIARDAR